MRRVLKAVMLMTGLWKHQYILIKTLKRSGFGKALYHTLEAVLTAQGILNTNACIAYCKNEDKYLTKNSVEFHVHMDYRPVGKFNKCGYKFNRWYDMVWMEKNNR